MYHVSAQGVDERMISVHYYYKHTHTRTHIHRTPTPQRKHTQTHAHTHTNTRTHKHTHTHTHKHTHTHTHMRAHTHTFHIGSHSTSVYFCPTILIKHYKQKGRVPVAVSSMAWVDYTLEDQQRRRIWSSSESTSGPLQLALQCCCFILSSILSQPVKVSNPACCVLLNALQCCCLCAVRQSSLMFSDDLILCSVVASVHRSSLSQ